MSRDGFTMLELLIVIIILGIMASLAVPVYTSGTKRAYKGEAYQTLQSVKESAVRYFSRNNSYAGLSLVTMDFDPNAVIGGQLRHFDYAIAVTGGGTGYLATASCENTAVPNVSSAIPECVPANDYITLDQVGVVESYGMFD